MSASSRYPRPVPQLMCQEIQNFTDKEIKGLPVHWEVTPRQRDTHTSRLSRGFGASTKNLPMVIIYLVMDSPLRWIARGELSLMSQNSNIIPETIGAIFSGINIA